MGLFDILTGNKTTKNGLNLIYSKNGDLLYEFNKIAGKIEGILKVYYSLTDSSNGPNLSSKKVGLVKEEYFFLNGLPNGNYKKFDLKSKLII
jgi:antitoxin component YwqK of YwqJK toxin-antitoxin module